MSRIALGQCPELPWDNVLNCPGTIIRSLKLKPAAYGQVIPDKYAMNVSNFTYMLADSDSDTQ
ncbi:hypothetical protein Bhyg_02201 [Pseudolycoriella hygida]|uniref:Uncharacterized protein n=1 Tax=Pseudolycoriella hygida TaxID=35572 RepID=A0A9Q0NCS9_9DIPT|nr:hypothetical protein Bhyg_02201 [Pseudolycoriella hygida]